MGCDCTTSLALYATLIATIFTSTAVSVDVQQQQQIKRACTGAAQPASTPPSAGLVGVGTQHLFDMAGDIGLSIVRNHITSAHLGGFTTTVSAPLLGDVDITVHDAHLQRLNATTAAATTAPQPDGTVQLDLHGFSVHVRCPLAFRRRAWPHISGHATAHINAHGGRATLVGNVTNEQGRPHVQLTHDAVVAFDDLDVRIADNKAAFLLNIVLLIAHGRVESAIQQEVQRQVGLQVPSLGNEVLQGLPVQADVLGIPLNISMQGDPHITLHTYEQRHWAQFTPPSSDANAEDRCPHEPGPLPPAANSGRMLEVYVSDAVPGCFLWTLFAIGRLSQYVVTQEQLGPQALSTATWRLAVPSLYSAYPDRQMAVLATATAAPTALVGPLAGPGGFGIAGQGRLTFHLATSNSRQPLGMPLFEVLVSGQLSSTQFGFTNASSPRLVAQLSPLPSSVHVEVVSSSVGPVHALPVRLELEVLVALMTDEVNRRVLAQGIALPAVPFIEFVKPELQLLSGALAVLTDLAYRSTAVLPL